MIENTLIRARIRTLRHEAEGVMSVELVPTGDAHFPRFAAGAHIDVHLANGMTRSYSLANSAEERDRYVLGVLLQESGRGGSKYLHSTFRCGMEITIGPPRNHFNLSNDARSSILIAGGIGITPILSMYRSLRESNQRVRLVYCARSRLQAGFVDEINGLGGDVLMHFDDEHDRAPVNLIELLEEEDKDVHAYCCGPSAMLEALQNACERSGIVNVHFERFALDTCASTLSLVGYTVELARARRSIHVTAGQTLLSALLNAGIEVDFSCEAGVCGSCELGVVTGTPDHRDAVLSASEKQANKKIIACVSGSLSEHLVLDL